MVGAFTSEADESGSIPVQVYRLKVKKVFTVFLLDAQQQEIV